jgi:hypothetical protein
VQGEAVQQRKPPPLAAVRATMQRDTMHPHPLAAILHVDATPIRPAIRYAASEDERAAAGCRAGA